MSDELADAIDRAMGVATFGMTAGTSEYVLRQKRVQAAAQAAREFYKIPIHALAAHKALKEGDRG